MDEASVIDFGSYLVAFARIADSGIGIQSFPPVAIDSYKISQIYDIALRESNQIETDNGSAMVQSKRSIILFKLGCNRREDWHDIIDMIKYDDDISWTVALREQIVSIFGPDSPQIERWDKLYSEATADQF